MPKLYRPCVAILYTLLLWGLTACESTSSSSSSSSSSSDSSATSAPAASSSSSGSDPSEPTADSSADASGHPPDEGKTSEEVIGGLDAELDESIAVFDGMILDERAKAEAIVADSPDPADGDAGDPGEVLFEEGAITTTPWRGGVPAPSR